MTPLLKNIIQDSNKHWLEAALDSYDQTTLREPKVRDYFSPSSAHLCPRAIWYQSKGYEQEAPSANGLRRMMTGTVYHTFIEEKLKGAGILVSSEQSVTWDDPPIHGTYDAIIERTQDKKHILLEIKSMAEPKNPKYKAVPKSEHVIQWNLYSLMADLEEGIILYVNKNSQVYEICEVHRDSAILDSILAKFKKLKSYLDEDKIVPYQVNENHDWCNFRTTCERDYFTKGV